MTRRHLSSGSTFEAVAGYSRAVIDGEWIFVAGTTGFDYATMTISDDPIVQTRQCFKTIADVLGEAGSSLADVVRVHYYATSREVLEALFPVFGEYMGEARPAATALICNLYDARMKIEIEVTARRRNAG